MSWETIYYCKCDICGMMVSINDLEWNSHTGLTPPGWKVNTESEHVCPDCWTQNKELHPKGIVWPSTRV